MAEVDRKMVFDLITKWNDSSNPANARNALRGLLGWDDENGVGLGTLVERFLANGTSQEAPPPPPWQSPTGGVFPSPFSPYTRRNLTRPTPVGDPHDFRAMWDALIEKSGKTCDVAKPILESGWDFTDVRPVERGRFDMPSDRIEGFLQDMSVDNYFMDELTDRQVGTLQAIFKAWRHWIRVR